MTKRCVTITIDSVLNMLRDYVPDGDIPADAKPIKMQINPREKRKIGIMIYSPSIKTGSAPQEIKFKLKRIYGVK